MGAHVVVAHKPTRHDWNNSHGEFMNAHVLGTYGCRSLAGCPCVLICRMLPMRVPVPGTLSTLNFWARVTSNEAWLTT